MLIRQRQQPHLKISVKICQSASVAIRLLWFDSLFGNALAQAQVCNLDVYGLYMDV